MDLMKFLLALVSQAGTKLPAIWPYVLHIAGDLKEISKIMGWKVAHEAASTPEERSNFVETCVDKGLSEDDALNVLESFGSVPRQLLILFAVLASLVFCTVCDAAGFVILNQPEVAARSPKPSGFVITRNEAVDSLAFASPRACDCLQGGDCICGTNCTCGANKFISMTGAQALSSGPTPWDDGGSPPVIPIHSPVVQRGTYRTVCKGGVCYVQQVTPTSTYYGPSVCANCPQASPVPVSTVTRTATYVEYGAGVRSDGGFRIWRPFKNIRANRQAARASRQGGC